MTSGGVGQQTPEMKAGDRFGWYAGNSLTSLERRMRRQAKTGELVDLVGQGSLNPTEMPKRTWGRKQTIRAAVLRHLLVDRQWPVHEKGIRLRGVRITGCLDLEGASLRCPLRLDNCYLDTRPTLNYASATWLELTDCHLPGLTGDTLVLTKDLVLEGSVFTNGINLPGADISGWLVCTNVTVKDIDGHGNALRASGATLGGHLYLDGFWGVGPVNLIGAVIRGHLNCKGAELWKADEEGDALIADWVKVGGNIYLDNFITFGVVRLHSAEITGQLSCRDACLEGRGQKGNSLVADSIKVGGRVILDGVYASKGGIRLPGADLTGRFQCLDARLEGRDERNRALLADQMKASGGVILNGTCTTVGGIRMMDALISGDLGCDGMHLKGADEQGNALFADGIEVSGNVSFGFRNLFSAQSGFTAEAALSLKSARVGGSLKLRPMKLADGRGARGNHDVALDLRGAKIAQDFVWEPEQPVQGTVILEDAEVGQLKDNLRFKPNGHWPSARQGQLQLDGFTYKRICEEHGRPPLKCTERLEWIGSRKRATTSVKHAFATQPYEQLAAVYRQAGQDRESRQVAIARRHDLRRYGDLTRYRKVGDWLLDKTIRYGYQTWRVAAALVALYLAIALVFMVAQHQKNLIVPTQDTKGIAPTALHCVANYPCFYPAGYAIDTVIPLINVHQADHWGPNPHAHFGWLLVNGAYIATAFGFILATLAIAGGLVGRSEVSLCSSALAASCKNCVSYRPAQAF
jgi:hypothetical protein